MFTLGQRYTCTNRDQEIVKTKILANTYKGEGKGTAWSLKGMKGMNLILPNMLIGVKL